MRILVTGSESFVGRALVSRLLGLSDFKSQEIERLLLLDQHLEHVHKDPRVRSYLGCATDRKLVRRILADGVDIIFHLAGTSCIAAEEHYPSSYQLNLIGSLELIEQLRLLRNRPRLIFASGVEAGDQDVARSLSQMPLVESASSCGTHKRMIELLIEDLGRRGELDGCAARLPEVVIGREICASFGTAFMNRLLTAVADGHPYKCPVSKDVTACWLSLDRCVENLLRLAELDQVSLLRHRVVQLPALRLTVENVLDVLEQHFGSNWRSLVTFASDSLIENGLDLEGGFPKTQKAHASDLGLRHDGNRRSLVKNAISPSE